MDINLVSAGTLLFFVMVIRPESLVSHWFFQILSLGFPILYINWIIFLILIEEEKCHPGDTGCLYPSGFLKSLRVAFPRIHFHHGRLS